MPEGLPQSKRKSAVALLVRKWAPFASTDYAVQWAGGRASVYAWDRDKVIEQMNQAGVNPARCTVWPEAFVRAPFQQGVRLVQAVDGVEAQVWRDGFLATGRWWPRLPSLYEWQAFLRAAGPEVDQSETSAVPAAQDIPFLQVPWTISQSAFPDVWSALQDRRIAAAALAVILAPAVFFVIQFATLSVATANVNGTIADLAQVNQAVRTDRAEAYANLEASEDIVALDPFPSQFEVMATAMRLLKDREVTLNEWNYDNGNLEFLVASTHQLDATFFITLFEKEDAFTNVSATTANQARELRLKMELVRRSGRKT